MAFSFFGSKEKHSEEIIKLATKIKTLMEINFNATNELINMLNENAMLNPPVENIKVDDKATLKEITATLVACIVQLQQKIERIHITLQNELDPQAYERLLSPDVNLEEKITIARRQLEASQSVNITTGGLLMIATVRSRQFLPTAVARFTLVETQKIAKLAFKILSADARSIVGATVDATVKGDASEETIREFDRGLGFFIPATNEYENNIHRMKATLEIHLERF